MVEDTMTCPKCGTEIPVSTALRESIESKANELYEKKFKSEMEKKIVDEREKLKERLGEEFNSKFSQMEDSISIKERHLQESQKRESEERKKRMELEENLREQKIASERLLDEEKVKMRESLRREYNEEFNLKSREIQQTNESLMKQVQDLKQKIEQGSQQLQGEVLEEELEDRLRGAFPMDAVVPVTQGTKGPDLIHTVKNSAGIDSGIIAWEAKRTKEWKDEWIMKLKGDLVNYNAETGVIVTKSLPRDISTFGVKNGILVTNFENAVPLAIIARMNLIELARQRRLGESSNETKDILYHYLTSTQFRQRVEAVADGIVRMRNDIESEKRSMERQWAKRTKEIDKAIGSISGMFGDLQGIIGPSLSNVKVLSLPDHDEE